MAHYLLTGYKPTPVLEYPTYGSVLATVRKDRGVLPAHVAVPNFAVGGGKVSGGGFLPATCRPFAVGGDLRGPIFGSRSGNVSGSHAGAITATPRLSSGPRSLHRGGGRR